MPTAPMKTPTQTPTVQAAPLDVPVLLAAHAETVARGFDTLLAQQHTAPPRLIEATRYSLEAGGKRLRPALVLECFEAAAADQSPSDRFHKAQAHTAAVGAAVALELVHTFSLVHDDLPAMDDDDLRRGRPTNHKVFGEAMAILAGDGMLSLAFEVLAQTAPPGGCAALVLELARATGPVGMIGGQVMDMDGENQRLDLAGLQAIHRKKTGALLTASCRMGALAAGNDAAALAAVTAYGDHLGLAFQIADDILDETGTPEQLGKATQKDAGRGKNTYPQLLGLDGARRAAAEQVQAAIDAVAGLGGRADRLRVLARFVAGRQV